MRDHTGSASRKTRSRRAHLRAASTRGGRSVGRKAPNEVEGQVERARLEQRTEPRPQSRSRPGPAAKRRPIPTRFVAHHNERPKLFADAVRRKAIEHPKSERRRDSRRRRTGTSGEARPEPRPPRPCSACIGTGASKPPASTSPSEESDSGRRGREESLALPWPLPAPHSKDTDAGRMDATLGSPRSHALTEMSDRTQSYVAPPLFQGCRGTTGNGVLAPSPSPSSSWPALRQCSASDRCPSHDIPPARLLRR